MTEYIMDEGTSQVKRNTKMCNKLFSASDLSLIAWATISVTDLQLFSRLDFPISSTQNATHNFIQVGNHGIILMESRMFVIVIY